MSDKSESDRCPFYVEFGTVIREDIVSDTLAIWWYNDPDGYPPDVYFVDRATGMNVQRTGENPSADEIRAAEEMRAAKFGSHKPGAFPNPVDIRRLTDAEINELYAYFDGPKFRNTLGKTVGSELRHAASIGAKLPFTMRMLHDAMKSGKL